MTEVRCPYCNEFICMSTGEVKRDKCKRCGKPVHVVVTSQGVFSVPEIVQVIPKQVSK